MASANATVVEYACNRCGTLLKSRLQSMGKKRRCPACQSYTIVNNGHPPANIARFHSSARDQEFARLRLAPVGNTARVTAPADAYGSVMSMRNPDTMIKLETPREPRVRDTAPPRSILVEGPISFRLKAQICFEWALALSVSVLALVVLYTAIAMGLSWITGFRLPG